MNCRSIGKLKKTLADFCSTDRSMGVTTTLDCFRGIFVSYGILVSLILAAKVVEAQTSTSCAAATYSLLTPSFDVSTLLCSNVGLNNFGLAYNLVGGNLSIVLSAVYTSGWVGIGFSKDGNMVGSSAMVGWQDTQGALQINQYYLGGQSSGAVAAGKGNLKLIGSPKVELLQGSIYLEFQVSSDSITPNLLFAYSTTAPSASVLQEHTAKISVAFNFKTGTQSVVVSNNNQLRTTHGILAIIGWGFILPIGAIIARYCREWDPLWFNLHVGFQIVGSALGFSAAIIGLVLYDRLKVNFENHRGLGITILVLGILQVSAIFARPKHEAKIRKYWNWVHHWNGRILLLFAAINIVLGLLFVQPGQSWTLGYGFALAFMLVAVVILEASFWIKQFKKPKPASFQMNPI